MKDAVYDRVEAAVGGGAIQHYARCHRKYEQNDQVEFEMQQGRKGMNAVSVRVLR